MNKHTSRQLTVRVKNDLALDADSYCAEVGLTFNGLVAVALSDFLRLRRKKAAAASPSPAARELPTDGPPPSLRDFRMRGSERNRPCICDSGRKFKNCCGKPVYGSSL